MMHSSKELQHGAVAYAYGRLYLIEQSIAECSLDQIDPNVKHHHQVFHLNA